MGRDAFKAWFAALSERDKVKALLIVMHEFTIAIRGMYDLTCEEKWRLSYNLSEINHRLTSAALATIDGEPTFPGDVLIDMILDQTNYAWLEGPCHFALEAAVRQCSPN